ncbi:hypothetical protein CZ674_12270 [Agrococcus casei LMG 22410]|uniref:Uncharacterized protein n=1 Tax=Agrococcus casei LMG 22410 TaxID=1255656 RepID=A0A1R4GIK7_9MICO|nr:hypothetical protein CZ674_12270 [Agrococcus casei LMG 22410]
MIATSSCGVPYIGYAIDAETATEAEKNEADASLPAIMR